MNLIGLDIGTTSICGVLYSKTLHKSMKVSTRTSELIKSNLGEYQQGSNAILQKILSVVDELIDYSSDKIIALSISSNANKQKY